MSKIKVGDLVNVSKVYALYEDHNPRRVIEIFWAKNTDEISCKLIWPPNATEYGTSAGRSFMTCLLSDCKLDVSEDRENKLNELLK